MSPTPVQPALRWAAMAGALFGQGCAISTGPLVGLMTDGSTVNLGQKLDGRLHLAEKQGLVVGIDEQIATRVGSDPCCSQWRALGAIGYADVPTVTTGAFGLDLVALVGGGRMPSSRGSVDGGLIAGGQVAVPVRLSRHRELWQADDYLGTSWQIVPDLTVLGFRPIRATDNKVDAEVSLGLSLRVFIFSSVLP